MNKWFKKFPYIGWATIFIVFLVASCATYYFEKQQHKESNLASKVQQDFLARAAAVHKELQVLATSADHYQTTKPSEYRYSFYLIKNSKPVFWNTAATDIPDNFIQHPDSFAAGKLVQLAQGFFYIKSFPLKVTNDSTSAECAIAAIPIAYVYPIENQYFQSYFVADSTIPMSTEILTNAEDEGSVGIKNSDGKIAFYIHFWETTSELYTVSVAVWILTICALFSLCFYIHEFCYGIGKRLKKPLLGWLLLLIFIVAFKNLLLQKIGYPIGFQNSMLFSPTLVSSGDDITSLGDLILRTILSNWLFIYLLAFVPIREWKSGKYKILNILGKLILIFVLVLSLYTNHADIMYQMVIDGKISFEVSDISGITRYTFLGIFTLSMLTINFLVVLGIVDALFCHLTNIKIIKYALFIVLSLFSVYLLNGDLQNYFHLSTMLASLIVFTLIVGFGLPLQTRSYNLSIAPTTYIWFAILCSGVTTEIFYFNYSKEQDLRKIFAQKQVKDDDELVSYSFDEFTAKFQQDSFVRQYFNAPTKELTAETHRYIFYTYLSDYAKEYIINVYYYNKQRKPIFNQDTLDAAVLRLADSINSSAHEYGLVNIEDKLSGNYLYWFMTPIPSLDEKDTIGYVGFSVGIENRPKSKDLRAFLNKKYNATDQRYFDNYSFGIYRKGILRSQGGEEIFPYRSATKPTKKEFVFEETIYSSTLIYRRTPSDNIYVVYKRNVVTDIISLFGYVLAVLLVILCLVLLCRLIFFYPKKLTRFFATFRFTIRAKINMTILVTVFASLFLVGLITISYLNTRYKNTQQKNLHNMLIYYSKHILRYADSKDVNLAAAATESSFSDFSFHLNELAEEQGADVNVYRTDGKLIASSQIELLRRGIVSKQMQYEILEQLISGNVSELNVEEIIGSWNYQSIYAPLRNESDQIVAYINLPYYASRKDLDDEISNVLASLINVYTLIFFLSGICAILISNNIIKSFRLLIEQFRNIRLSKNEIIKWPYKDEIGVLVKEYNAMMQKVEAMASKLARTEREEAWREIAKQVAHEIKNPLTPMKLNIQYLQQAIQSGRPDIEGLASRVSVTLIEQIENLNLIASEFSNFAKMPEATPKQLMLHDALQSLVLLFQKDEHVQVELLTKHKLLYIEIDKGYFIRIFNNLVQNAIQAIDDKPNGSVTISYEQKDNMVVVSVHDNGGGIAEDMQEKLFVPYFTTKSSGTGLGLPMTKNMVENSGGTIWFKSIIGQGSTFFVQLPVVTPH